MMSAFKGINSVTRCPGTNVMWTKTGAIKTGSPRKIIFVAGFTRIAVAAFLLIWSLYQRIGEVWCDSCATCAQLSARRNICDSGFLLGFLLPHLHRSKAPAIPLRYEDFPPMFFQQEILPIGLQPRTYHGNRAVFGLQHGHSER